MKLFSKSLYLTMALVLCSVVQVLAQEEDEDGPQIPTQPFSISGSGPSGCGGVAQFNSMGGDPNATVWWEISFSSGGNWSSGGPSITLNFPQASGTATVTATKGNETKTLEVPYGDTPPAKPDLIVGHKNVCGNRAIRNYSISAVPGADEYTWTAESPFRIIHPVSGNLVSSYTGTELDVFVRFPNSGSVTEGKISVYASTTGPCSASSRVRNKKVNFGPQLYPLSGPETINRFDRARYILSARNISNLTWSLPSALLLRAELSNYMIEVEAVGDAVGYVTATYLTCGESRSVSQFVRVVPGPLGRGAEEISLDLPTTSLYPNPAVDEVTINSGYLLKQVSVINLVGQTVKTISEVEDYQARLDISGLEPGTYLVVAWDTEGKKIHKLIVE